MRTITELFAEGARYARVPGWKGMVRIDKEGVVPCDERGFAVDTQQGTEHHQKYAERSIWEAATPEPPAPKPERRKRGKPD